LDMPSVQIAGAAKTGPPRSLCPGGSYLSG
jgi:hypothetical protein